MQAIVTNVLNGTIECKTVPKPLPTKGQMLCRCLACGICGTDLHTMQYGAKGSWVQALNVARERSDGSVRAGGFDSSKDCILGHEFVCRIEETNDESMTSILGEKLSVGDRVVSLCRVTEEDGSAGGVGYSNKNPGGYAEFMVLSSRWCVKVPDHVPDSHAALTEPMAVGYHAVKKSNIETDEVPIVIGCGPVGLSVIVALKAIGIERVIAADFAEGRR